MPTAGLGLAGADARGHLLRPAEHGGAPGGGDPGGGLQRHAVVELVELQLVGGVEGDRLDAVGRTELDPLDLGPGDLFVELGLPEGLRLQQQGLKIGGQGVEGAVADGAGRIGPAGHLHGAVVAGDLREVQ